MFFDPVKHIQLCNDITRLGLSTTSSAALANMAAASDAYKAVSSAYGGGRKKKSVPAKRTQKTKTQTTKQRKSASKSAPKPTPFPVMPFNPFAFYADVLNQQKTSTTKSRSTRRTSSARDKAFSFSSEVPLPLQFAKSFFDLQKQAFQPAAPVLKSPVEFWQESLAKSWTNPGLGSPWFMAGLLAGRFPMTGPQSAAGFDLTPWADMWKSNPFFNQHNSGLAPGIENLGPFAPFFKRERSAFEKMTDPLDLAKSVPAWQSFNASLNPVAAQKLKPALPSAFQPEKIAAGLTALFLAPQMMMASGTGPWTVFSG